MFYKELTLRNQMNEWFFIIGILKILAINMSYVCNGCHDILKMAY